MSDYNRGGSERGSIQPRQARAGLAGVFDWDPFRSMLTGNWQHMFGIDVNRREDGYDIEMPVPGFRPMDLDVSYQDGVITVTGRNDKRTFSRTLSLPEDINEESIEAKVENGMLIISLKQTPKQQPKKITVTGTVESPQTAQTSK
jgi:HSP20 family protein